MDCDVCFGIGYMASESCMMRAHIGRCPDCETCRICDGEGAF